MAASFIPYLSELTESYASATNLLLIAVLAALPIVVWLTAARSFKHGARAAVARSGVFSSSDADVVIVGSGVLGSALASTLAKDGRRVVVVERDLQQPDRIVGELLQPGGCRALAALGLADCLKDIDVQKVEGYVIHDVESSASVHIPYPADEGKPATGASFVHGKFIASLRKAAQAQPGVTYIEGTATELVEKDGIVIGVRYRQKDDGELKELRARLTVVADGLFSKFRSRMVKERAKTYSHFCGCVMMNCPQALDRHAELVLAKPNPILVYRISDDETRVLVDVRGDMPDNLREYLLERIAPAMPDHLRGPFEDGVTHGRVRHMPCNFLPAAPLAIDGALILGDAFNMRHPLTGGGMSVALNDVLLWRDLLRQLPDLTDYEAVDKARRRFLSQRKASHSFVVNVLSVALYELFSAEDVHLQRLRRACFEYFKLGGQCVSGPVGLLSVLTPNPMTLIGHFFAVALYAVWFIFKTQKWAIHTALYQSVGTFGKACVVIFPLIWSEVKTLTSSFVI